MAVADFLKDIGEGVKTGARAVGAVAGPVLERTAQVVSGEAPEIDAEKRKRDEKLEDEQIAAKAAVLENNLAMGQKYGTLTPDQQQQYIDAITGLYNKPRHAPLLMEKLRKAIHPNGAYNQGPVAATLPSATPAGGTAAVDEAQREKALADTLGLRQAATDEEIDRRAINAQKYPRRSTGKSPPLPGSQLPADAVGPDGSPISEADRTAAKSFVEWGGQWWPVAKPKPVFKIIKGHEVLADAQTGAILRDLGPTGAAKVTTRQTLQPGDDGQMHLVNLTSVTTPEGATIDVQTEDSPTAQPSPAPQPNSAPKAKGVGSILPKQPAPGAKPGAPSSTGAKPVSVAGPVVPGLSTLAKSKNPLYKDDNERYKKLAEDADAKKKVYQNAQALLANNERKTDLELIFAWVRSNMQGAGRMTNTEIQQAAQAGSWGTRLQNAASIAATGRLTPELEKQFFSDIQNSYQNAQKDADELRKQMQGPDNGSGSSSNSDIDQIVAAIKSKQAAKK